MTDVGLPAFLDITPFGPYCKPCNVPLPIQRGIASHGKEVHPNDAFKNNAVIREVQRRMKVLREVHANDLSPFLTEQRSENPTWFCTVCFSTFTKSCNYNRHLEVRSNILCLGGTGGGKIQCYVTICGRLGPKSCNAIDCSPTTTPTIVTATRSVSMLSDLTSHSSVKKSLSVESNSKVPAPLLITKEQACEILKPFARPDEDVTFLYQNYLPILTPGFEGRMKEYLNYSTQQSSVDATLYNWLEAGREWFNNYADGHIANVSANVRSRLAEFEQKEVDGAVVRGSSFALRRGIPRLINELEALLRFFYYFPTTLFDAFKTSEVRVATKAWMIEAAVIPKILFTSVAEEPDDHGKLPVVCLYCLSRGFSLKAGCDLVMTECGWFASRVSAVLHLLRAGVCGYLVTLSGYGSDSALTEQEMDIVGRVQNGRVTNLLAPYIRRLREAHAKKPKVISHTVNSVGDITSGSFTFVHSVWSTLIPRLEHISRECFGEIFQGRDWMEFMVCPIVMVDWVQLDAFVKPSGSSRIRLCDLVVNYDMEPVVTRLQSVVQLCFYGLGVGAVRYEEVLRLSVLSCQWYNSYLYYSTESIKKGSLKATSMPKMVQHRLSLTLSPIVLLARYAMVVYCDAIPKETLFSDYPNGSIMRLVQEIFGLDSLPNKLSVRHLFASIGNVIMPEKGSIEANGFLVSASVMTEKSGHTQMTGRHSYGTWLQNSEEALYDRYHGALGESIVEPPILDYIPLSDFVLKASLRQLLGQTASYRSDDQKRMIEVAANSTVRHAYVGLACGQGKSLSWMVPTMASYLSGRFVGLRIVIVPYKFLLGHVVQHAQTLFGQLSSKLKVSFLDSSQIDEEETPNVLTGDSLPCLLFLNLDGASSLLQFHLSTLQRLAEQDVLKRIYLDELQQLLIEYGFRSAYQSLQALGRIGVPVMCLSGSLPCSMAMSCMAYCGLNHSMREDCVDIVPSSDPVGDGFSFDVSIVSDISDEVVRYVLGFRVGACHILCSSKRMVDDITERLGKVLDVLSITGDSSYKDQIACAKKWYSGKYDVLVSTVVALVGNENRRCKTIVVAGFLFNVSSLVKAIGRLRPEQRGSASKVQVFRLSQTSSSLRYALKSGENQFEELVQAECLQPESRDQYQNLFGPIGLHKLLSLREGCYVQTLAQYYGFQRMPCTRCGLCREAVVTANSKLPTVTVATAAAMSKLNPQASFHADDILEEGSDEGVMETGWCQSVEAALEENNAREVRTKFINGKVLLPITESGSMFGVASTVTGLSGDVGTPEIGNGVVNGGSQDAKRVHSKPAVTNPYNKVARAHKENSVAVSKKRCELDNKTMRHLREQANCVLSELLYRCIACGFTKCDGECAEGCYRCGDKRHGSNTCPFDTKRLAVILRNKGVCFGCFDTRQHTMKDHDIRSCTLKKRLRRLLFIDHAKTGMPYEKYLRHLYSSENTFVRFVASFSGNTSLGRLVVPNIGNLVRLVCVQVGLEMLNAPLLPPSNIRKSNDVAVLIGKSDIQFEDAASARDWYQVLRQRTLSRLRQRKFVYGAIYTDLFPGYFCVDPAKASYDLVVTLASGERSLVQVRRVAVDDEIDSIALLTSLVDLGGTLLKYCKGNCRGKKVGEIGMMYAMGVRSSRTNAFYSCKDVVIESVTISSTLMTAWMMKNMNNVLQEIKITVESMKVRRWPALTNGPGSRMVVSVNLGNSPHYDVGDTSSSVAVWVEEKPGTADNWYFILPNVSFVGSTGLAIKLGHGVAISWDGRDIYHCTSNTVTGNQNNVYGCLWGSCSRF